jgi:hypothetical protein
LNLKFAGKQDKQSNLPGGDWRDTIDVGWTLVLTVAGEKDAIDDGKNKKMRGEVVMEYPWMVTVQSWTTERKR